MTKEELKKTLRTVPDFPIPGILFWDVTTLFKNPEALRDVTEKTYELYKDKGITKVVGIESRGFVVGSAVAIRLGAGFVPARKPGKLPAITMSVSYKKEYGIDSIEIHADAITHDDVVLIHDDLLATGGSANAVISLVKQFHPKKIYCNFIIDLLEFKDSRQLPDDVEVTSMLQL